MKNKKYSYLLGLLLFVLFVPKVYALSYEIDTKVNNTSVSVGTVTEIRVGVKNVQGTSDGIFSCSLDIEFDKNLLLDSKVRTLGNWTMTTGNFYLFDTGNPAIEDTEIFVIPVKINGNGAVKLVDIECTDGNVISEFGDRIINFNVKDNEGTGNSDEVDSNCDLSDIVLSEGTIEFDPAVTDYNIEVKEIDNLMVEPILASNKANFTIDKTDTNVVIKVVAEDGSEKTYNIFIEEVDNNIDKSKDKNSFIPIFIGIICLLVLINIVRIIKNIKK